MSLWVRCMFSKSATSKNNDHQLYHQVVMRKEEGCTVLYWSTFYVRMCTFDTTMLRRKYDITIKANEKKKREQTTNRPVHVQLFSQERDIALNNQVVRTWEERWKIKFNIERLHQRCLPEEQCCCCCAVPFSTRASRVRIEELPKKSFCFLPNDEMAKILFRFLSQKRDIGKLNFFSSHKICKIPKKKQIKDPKSKKQTNRNS